jgi:hypothetical protein
MVQTATDRRRRGAACDADDTDPPPGWRHRLAGSRSLAEQTCVVEDLRVREAYPADFSRPIYRSTKEPQMMATLDYLTPAPTPAPIRGVMFWGGWVLTVLVSLMLAMGGVMNVTRAPMAVEGLSKYGYPPGVLVPLGLVVLAAVALYLVPRTAVLGAILLTGYLGGAVNTHVRAGEPWFVAAIVGVLVWLALYLRDARIRALVPLRSAG